MRGPRNKMPLLACTTSLQRWCLHGPLVRAAQGGSHFVTSCYATLSTLSLFYGKPVSDVGYELAARARMRAYLQNVQGYDILGKGLVVWLESQKQS